MDKYTKPVRQTTGGIDPFKWFDTYYLKNKGLVGNDKIPIVTAEGTIESIPLKDVAIMFMDFNVHRSGDQHYNYYDICTFGSVGSNSVTASPLALVSCKEAWNPGFLQECKHNHILTKKRRGMYMVQPICLFDAQTDETEKIRIMGLIEQCARLWVSGGSNNIDMSLQHASNMYVCQSSSLVYSAYTHFLNGLIRENDVDKIKEYVTMITLHTRSFMSLVKLFPEMLKPMEALSESTYCCDVLQRTIASIFVNHMLEPEDYLRMLELSIKRTVRRYGTIKNFKKNPIAGMTAIFMFTPIFQKICHNVLSIDEAVAEVIKTTNLFLDAVDKNEHLFNRTNKEVLKQLVNNSEICGKVSDSTLESLYDWCINQDNRLKDFDLENVFGKPTVDFAYEVNKLKIRSHPLLNICRVKSNNNVTKLIAKNPAEWSGIMFMSSGKYYFTPTIIGIAKQGKNDTRRNHMTAVICFTTGNNLLPTKKNMISSAGEISVKSDNSIYNFTKIIDLTCPFVLEINKKSFTITQNNNIFYIGSTRQSKVMVSFRYLKLRLEYDADNHFEINKQSYNRLMRKEHDIIDELYEKKTKDVKRMNEAFVNINNVSMAV